MFIDGIEIRGNVSEHEAAEYMKRAPIGTYLIECEPYGEYVNLTYYYENKAPFERIRRITGYLVGSLDRFNDAKLAEVNDRVKHSL